jgi:hypothetical protein
VPKQSKPRGVTWRAVLLASVLAPVECYWLIQMEIVRGAGFSSTVSLFFTVVLTVLALQGLNAPLRRWRPRWALSRGELLTVFAMLSIVTSLCAIDAMEALLCIIPYAFWRATPENRWEALFHRYVPDWLVVRDPEALKGFYNGSSTFWQPAYLHAWARPILWWTLFITVLLATMLCLNAILRRRWTDHDRLTYPIAQIPFEITDPAGALWRNRAFWAGFGIAGLYDLLNGFHSLWPEVPGLDLTRMNTLDWNLSRPWNAIGWTPIAFFPFVIGLGFLLPTDLLFSFWFFFLVWKLENVLGALWGLEVGRHQWPYMDEQSLGAYLAVTAFVLYAGRSHFAAALRAAVGRRRPDEDGGRGEPLPYSVAVWGMVLGLGFLVGFAVVAGLAAWAAVAFFGLYLAIALSIARMRAQLGPPTHDLHFIGPDQTLVASLGTQAFDGRSLTVLSYFYWFNRAYRNHPMPHQLEAFRLGQRAGLNLTHLSGALILAGVVGSLAVFGTYLHIAYTLGAAAKMTGWGTYGYAVEVFNRLASWLSLGQEPSTAGITATLGGFLFALGLMALQSRFVFLPLHPLGYAISGGWSGHWTYSSLFVAWLLKVLLLRYGGYRTYRRAIPGFIGLVLGQFVVGGLWSFIGIIGGWQTYAFWRG